MKKQEVRYLVVLVIVLGIITIAGFVYSSLLESSTRAGFREQQLIETRNAMFDLTATAVKQQP